MEVAGSSTKEEVTTGGVDITAGVGIDDLIGVGGNVCNGDGVDVTGTAMGTGEGVFSTSLTTLTLAATVRGGNSIPSRIAARTSLFVTILLLMVPPVQ